MNENINLILNNELSQKRGRIIEIDSNEYRFDYYDVSESDTSMMFLIEKGYQGGGETWEAIIREAIQIVDTSLEVNLNFDPESEGLDIWSDDKPKLQKISRLVAYIKNNNSFFLKCIQNGEQNGSLVPNSFF